MNKPASHYRRQIPAILEEVRSLAQIESGLALTAGTYAAMLAETLRLLADQIDLNATQAQTISDLAIARGEVPVPEVTS